MPFDFRKGLSSFTESVTDFGSNIQQNLQPFAQRTRQQLAEKFVGSEDTTALPTDYTELEKQYDELIPANLALLKILSIYEMEGYDIPPNIKDTLTSTYKGMHDRLLGITQAVSAQEAGKILISGTPEASAQAAQEPRTLHHVLGRALDNISQTLTGINKDQIGPVLAQVAAAEETLGNAQKEQDQEISQVSTGLRAMINETQSVVAKSRRNVHNTRLDLDVKKSALRHASPNAPNLASLETEVERAEDDFVAAIEDASMLMKNAISTSSYKSVQVSIHLVKAQREYHRSAAEHLDTLLPSLEKLEAEARDLMEAHNA